jgi:hypothetical protein
MTCFVSYLSVCCNAFHCALCNHVVASLIVSYMQCRLACMDTTPSHFYFDLPHWNVDMKSFRACMVKLPCNACCMCFFFLKAGSKGQHMLTATVAGACKEVFQTTHAVQYIITQPVLSTHEATSNLGSEHGAFSKCLGAVMAAPVAHCFASLQVSAAFVPSHVATAALHEFVRKSLLCTSPTSCKLYTCKDQNQQRTKAGKQNGEPPCPPVGLQPVRP